MKRSRILYLHEGVNQGKLESLEALHAEYSRYLRACIDRMIEARRARIPRAELLSFFPDEGVLSTNIVTACQQHSVEIVSGWFASVYSRSLKRVIKTHFKDDEPIRHALSTVGKHSISKPWKFVTQDHLDLYWSLLLDPEVSGRPPAVSDRVGMRTSTHTSDLRDDIDTTLTPWWVGISCLERGKRIQLPLKSNPHVKTVKEIRKGCLVRKDRLGRWRLEVLEAEDIPEPEVDPEAPRLGVDVGLNVIAATSDGRLFGTSEKPKFDRLYSKVRSIRANRQRQGFKENSKRLDRLEMKLSGMVKTVTGEVANKLIEAYPGHTFVVEDLDLKGCRGQKRFAYRALHRALSRKASCLAVNPAYTSQECPSCGYVSRRNRNGTTFCCRSCGRISHADVVGGINLLRRSEDSLIDLDDHPSEVRNFVRERFRTRRSSLRTSSSRSMNEFRAWNRRLTTEVFPSGKIGTVSNAEVFS